MIARKTPEHRSPTRTIEENAVLAHLLEETAELLSSQDANPFRVQAYRNAATAIRSRALPLRETWEREGREGLLGLPHIGESLSRTIETWLVTGTLGILQRLRGDEAGERILRSVAGIGKSLAHRIHHDLGVSSLEELEAAAHDGRLGGLAGIGSRRLQAIRDQLDSRLRRRRVSGDDAGRYFGAGDAERPRPQVAEILDVDREYRERAAEGRLPRIAPRRFNPKREAWLPVLHTHRDRRYYTALFSNTARAHELGRHEDWVIIYLDDGVGETQWTVVTEHLQPLAGKRVVRGRERECFEHYEKNSLPGPPPPGAGV